MKIAICKFEKFESRGYNTLRLVEIVPIYAVSVHFLMKKTTKKGNLAKNRILKPFTALLQSANDITCVEKISCRKRAFLDG